VQDFGVGIEKDQQKKIFERLYQVSNPNEKTYPGLGLGLFICKEIVERHKGKLWVESTKGKGSTFSFSLPLTNKKR
jgi:signal transduction histidine kinase